MTETENAIRSLQERMIRMSGIEPRLRYLLEECSPEGIAAAREYVRLSRLKDYEDAERDGIRWGSYTHSALAKRIIDAILRDVFQGKKQHLREHMVAVAARVDRGLTMEPFWEAHLDEMCAEAWDEGLADGMRAATSVPRTGMTYRLPDNPFRANSERPGGSDGT